MKKMLLVLLSMWSIISYGSDVKRSVEREERLTEEVRLCLDCVKHLISGLNKQEWESVVESIYCEEGEGPTTYAEAISLLGQALQKLLACLGCCESEETVFACLAEIKSLCEMLHPENGEITLSRLCELESKVETLIETLEEHDNQICLKYGALNTKIDIVEGNLDSTVGQLMAVQTFIGGIESLLDHIEDQKEELTECAPIMITEARAITNGDPSGVYCLANDITGTITIARSDVILDLNEHEITVLPNTQGIYLEDIISNITIRNGSIVGQVNNNSGIMCAFNTVQEELCIENIKLNDLSTAIRLDNTFQVHIREVQIVGGTGGIIGIDARNVWIQQSRLCQMFAGIFLRYSNENTQSSIVVAHCSYEGEGVGVQVRDGAFLLVAHNNFIKGALVGGLIGIEIATAFAQNSTATMICYDNVVSSMATGYQVSGTSVGVIENCIAFGNNRGFSHISGDVSFYNNIACDNVTNYSGLVISSGDAPIAFSNSALGLDNLICESQVDTISVIESKVCESESTLEVIESKLDVLNEQQECAPIVITAPREINSGDPSGVYCLANDITGTITISRSNVVLDLHGHQVSSETSAIVIEGAVCDITVRNGKVVGIADEVLAAEGIRCDSGGFQEGIRIEQVSFTAWTKAVSIENAAKIVLEFLIIKNSDTGICMDNVREVVIHNGLIDTITFQGMFISASKSISVEDMQIRAASTGIFFSGSSCITCKTCVITQLVMGVDEVGIDIEECQSVTIDGCTTCLYTTGFLCGATTACIIRQCKALNDGTGFYASGVANGIVFYTNQALGCLDIGFDDDDTVNSYYNNVACDNSTNYGATIEAGTNAPVTSENNARGLDNIDCDNNDENKEGAIFSKLCLLVEEVINF
ncbi:MAG: NosD domain-containing protein [Candidatus Babeliales bacterium]